MDSRRKLESWLGGQQTRGKALMWGYGCYAGAPLTASSLLGKGIAVETPPTQEKLEAALEAAEAYATMGDQGSRASGSKGLEGAKAGPVQMGAGLMAMPSRLVDRIRRGEYVNLTEVPPATPEGVSPGVHMEYQVLIVRAADLKQSKHRISDMAV